MVKLKNFLFGLILLFILLLFFGCTTRIWPPVDAASCAAYPNTLGGGMDSSDRPKFECLSYVAIQKNDSSICQSSDAITTGKCLEQFAVQKRDSNVCESIADNLVESGGFGFSFVTVGVDRNDGYKMKEECYLLTSTIENPHCDKLTSKDLKVECAQRYDMSLCYDVQDLNYRAKCFGVPLISGIIVGLEDYYKMNKCDEKIKSLIDDGVVYKRDFSNPDAYNELPLDYCVIIKGALEGNPNVCSLLTKAGAGVMDYCYSTLSEYFQTDYCSSLKPSCSYSGSELRVDALVVEPNAFGKEYCQALSREYKTTNGVPNIPSISDLSFCPSGVTPNITSGFDYGDANTGYGWKKFTGGASFPISCSAFCSARPECLITSKLKGCFKTSTYNGNPTDNAGVNCVLSAPENLTEKDVGTLNCCCPKGDVPKVICGFFHTKDSQYAQLRDLSNGPAGLNYLFVDINNFREYFDESKEPDIYYHGPLYYFSGDTFASNTDFMRAISEASHSDPLVIITNPKFSNNTIIGFDKFTYMDQDAKNYLSICPN